MGRGDENEDGIGDRRWEIGEFVNAEVKVNVKIFTPGDQVGRALRTRLV